MKGMNPYLNFDGNTREAFEFYRSVFGGELRGPMTFRDMGGESMGISGDELERVMHVALQLDDKITLMGSDIMPSMGHKLNVGNNVYISLDVNSAEEAQRLYSKLEPGGNVQMPLEEADWAERFAILSDKFGVLWMINYTGNKEPSGS